MSFRLEQNEATAARRRIAFYLVDDTDGKTPETLVVPSATELQLSKNGAAFANFAGTWTENAAGLYHYEATQAELDTLGFLVLKFVKSGIRTEIREVQVEFNDPYGNINVGLISGAIAAGQFATDAISTAAVSAGAVGKIADGVFDEDMTTHTGANTLGEHFGIGKRAAVVANGGNTAATFLTNLTESTTDYWKRTILVVVSGALRGQVSKVSGYNGSTKFVTLQDALTATPSAADAFLLINS